MKTWYSVVVFGRPKGRWRKVFTDLHAAAHEAARIKGTGACTYVEVWECNSRKLARLADISMLVPVEVIQFAA